VTRVRPGAWLGPRAIAPALALSIAAGLLARTYPWIPVVSILLAAFVLACVLDARASGGMLRWRRIAPERYALARADAFHYELENRATLPLRVGIVEAPVA
jgi:hypothetical protein